MEKIDTDCKQQWTWKMLGQSFQDLQTVPDVAPLVVALVWVPFMAMPRDAKPPFDWRDKKTLLLYVRSSTSTRPEDTPDAEVHEKYIELMCKYQPDLVHSYLRNTENYRLEETLAVWTVLKINMLFCRVCNIETHEALEVKGTFVTFMNS